MIANKRHQLLGRCQESHCINNTEQSQNDKTCEPIRISGREKVLEKTLLVHYGTVVPEAHSIRNSDISREHANAFGVRNPHSVLENCQGGDSNSRPRAYESPALPLSYPGEIGGDKGQSRHSRCQRERNP